MIALWVLGCALLLCAAPAPAQALPPSPGQAGSLCRLSRLQVCVRHVIEDEKGIVMSPLHAPPSDLWWILPFGAATGLAVEQDTKAIRDLGVHPNRENNFNNLSTYGGLYLPFGAAAAAYGWGIHRNNDYLTETAVLAAEAMADAGILDEGLKYAIDREYPLADNARGALWPKGLKGWPNNPSMPSEHAMNIWSFAHVVAGQYNGIATQTLVYGLATTVSVSRVIARRHFPSDVLVGSTLGWLIGGYVLHHRSLENGESVDLSEVDTPLGRGLQLSFSLSRGQRGQ